MSDEKVEEPLFVDGMIFRFNAIDKYALPDGFLEASGILKQFDSPSVTYSENGLVEFKFNRMKYQYFHDDENIKKFNDYFIERVIEGMKCIGYKYELIESGAIFNVQGLQEIMFFNNDNNKDQHFIYNVNDEQVQYLKKTILKQQKET